MTERRLLCDQNEVRLKSKDLDILLVLLKNRSRLVTKAELMEEVWPDSYVAEANLGVHIASLRKILRAHSPGDRYIETVHKYGYRFVEATVESTFPSLVVDEPENLMICTEAEAILSLAGGLRIEARKGASGTEVTMTITKTSESTSTSWSVQRDGVRITSTPFGGTSCVRILFEDG